MMLFIVHISLVLSKRKQLVNFHSLEVVSRYRDPQLQVTDNFVRMWKIYYSVNIKQLISVNIRDMLHRGKHQMLLFKDRRKTTLDPSAQNVHSVFIVANNIHVRHTYRW